MRNFIRFCLGMISFIEIMFFSWFCLFAPTAIIILAFELLNNL